MHDAELSRGRQRACAKKNSPELATPHLAYPSSHSPFEHPPSECYSRALARVRCGASVTDTLSHLGTVRRIVILVVTKILRLRVAAREGLAHTGVSLSFNRQRCDVSGSSSHSKAKHPQENSQAPHLYPPLGQGHPPSAIYVQASMRSENSNMDKQ